MCTKPNVVIVSSSNTKPKSLIKLMTATTTLPNEAEDSEKVCKSWIIDTKYYTAEVNLVGITENYVRTQEFNDNVEALIIHMDSNKKTGLEDLKVWESIENNCEPDVKLLISNYCNNETKVTRDKAIEWCLKRGYELIELYPAKSPINDTEDDIIKEKVGVERIVEALQAHVWSNLVMKKKENENVKVHPKTKQNQDSLDSFLTDEGVDDFADLFQQLHDMKDSIQSMPIAQRHQCAEQMVTAFWRAIGGDEEEIVDL